MKFLRNFFAAFLALVVFSLVSLFFLGAIISTMESSEEFVLEENSILKLSLTQPLSDRDFDDPFANYSFGTGTANRIGVIDIRRALEHAANDDKIKGIVLYAPTLMGGFAMGQEVRKSLLEFKKSGKFILAYSEILSEGGYYISSVADSVYLSPEGMIEWNGLTVEMNFFKRTFEKLEIEPQIFRVGEYKSAVEPYILEKMSKENRVQIKSMLNSIYGSIVSDVAETVNLTKDQLLVISNSMTVHNGKEAVEQGLITGLLYHDEFEKLIADKIDLTSAEDINWVSYSEYNTSFSSYVKSKNKIAVIIAEGEIRMGKKQKGVITPGQFTRELRKAREDDNVKAVVFRINSPGGDALASDIIWREVVKTREVKPVIASFSNYGASGGYYLAMAADTIVAEPTTLTGSIGIYGMVFNIGDFMANKLGITTDRESTGNFSNLYTASRSLTIAEKAIIQNQVNNGYETFTSKAAQGRGMDIDDLKAIASGRVWTGVQAKENGLIDVLGGLDTAIEIAAKKAGVANDFKVRYYPVKKTALEELMEELSGATQTSLMKAKLGELFPYMELLDKVENMRGVQARIPYEIEIN